MVDVSKIKIASKILSAFFERDQIPDDVFIKTCELMWPRENEKTYSKEYIMTVLKEEFGERANFVIEFLVKENLNEK